MDGGRGAPEIMVTDMASDEYWKERSVSWGGVAAGFTIAALAMTGLLVLEVASQLTSGSMRDVSPPVAGSNAFAHLERDQQPHRSTYEFVPASSLPDEEEQFFNCLICE